MNKPTTLLGTMFATGLLAVAGAAVAAPFTIDDFSLSTPGCISTTTGVPCTDDLSDPSLFGGLREINATKTSENGSVSVGVDSGVFYWSNAAPGGRSTGTLSYSPTNFDLTQAGTSSGFDLLFGTDIAGSTLTITVLDGMTASTWSMVLPGTASVLTPLYIPFTSFNSNAGCVACTSADKVTFSFDSNGVSNIDVEFKIIQLREIPQNNTPIPGTIVLLGLGILGLAGLGRKLK